MKRLLSTCAILALAFALASCSLANRMLQAPARLFQAGARTITGSVEAPDGDPGAKVALRRAIPVAR